MHCFVFLSLLSHYSTAVFTRVPFFDRKAKGVKGLDRFCLMWLHNAHLGCALGVMRGMTLHLVKVLILKRVCFQCTKSAIKYFS